MEKKLWLVPEYFSSFACKCGACRNACCRSWKIAVTEKEYFRMIGMNCSKELHDKLESAFSIPDFPSSDKFRMIEPDWRGQCRMLDSDGLCMLQKECGEPALSEICRVYPRSCKAENDRLQACCSSSCEAVVELLMEADRLEFSLKEIAAVPEISETIESDFQEAEQKAIDILQDRSLSLQERIIKICEQNGYERSGELSALEIIEIIGCLSEESRTIQDYLEDLLKLKDLDEAAVEETLKKASVDFSANFPEWERYFENILVNNLFYSAFPCADRRIKSREACSGLALQYLFLKLICAVFLQNDPSKERFVDCIAAIYHLVEHTAFYYNSKILLKNPMNLFWI